MRSLRRSTRAVVGLLLTWIGVGVGACGNTKAGSKPASDGQAGRPLVEATGGASGHQAGQSPVGAMGGASGHQGGQPPVHAAGGITVEDHPEVQIVGSGPVPHCSGYVIGHHSGWQIVLPDGTDFADTSQGGASGDAAHSCQIPIVFDLLCPDLAFLSLDCELLPYASPDDGDFSWEYDDPEAPTLFRLSRAACEAVVRDGFGRIDFWSTTCSTGMPL